MPPLTTAHPACPACPACSACNQMPLGRAPRWRAASLAWPLCWRSRASRMLVGGGAAVHWGPSKSEGPPSALAARARPGQLEHATLLFAPGDQAATPMLHPRIILLTPAPPRPGCRHARHQHAIHPVRQARRRHPVCGHRPVPPAHGSGRCQPDQHWLRPAARVRAAPVSTRAPAAASTTPDPW